MRQLPGLFGGEPTATSRAAELRQPQQERVLQVLFEAYPAPISHADICERIGTNRASHRIAELQAEGWKIAGLGELPLDAATQTQLYQLKQPTKGTGTRKLAGFTVRWTDDAGLRVTVHKDCTGPIPPGVLDALAGILHVTVRDSLDPYLPDAPKPHSMSGRS
jgi:hypothetical protein